MAYLKVLLFLFLYSTANYAQNFTYKKTDDTGLGKQERLDSIETFLVGLDQKIKAIQEKNKGGQDQLKERLDKLTENVDQLKSSLTALTKQFDGMKENDKQDSKKDDPQILKKGDALIEDLKTRIEYLESRQQGSLTD